VVDPEQVQQSCVEVVDVDAIFNRMPAEVIRAADDLPRLDSTTRHPRAETEAVMITSRIGADGGILGNSCPAKFGAPDHECLVEQSSLLEIANQGPDRLIYDSTVAGQLIV